MDRNMQSALISVFYKDGLEPIVRKLNELGISLYSTGGTQTFIESLGLPCNSVEGVTNYPSILGGRVKTLHPKVFGGILARREMEEDRQHVAEYEIPFFDLVIVDLYPFEETVASTDDESKIIEKIDIGGVSLIRAAAKNHKDVAIVSSRAQYASFLQMLESGSGTLTYAQRRELAAAAFAECAHYDVAISDYFNTTRQVLRYGENPHQQAHFSGNLEQIFDKLNGKELSYNNLVDVDAACQLIGEFEDTVFAIIKHTNVCGVAQRDTVSEAWEAALAGDPESAFGGVLVTNAVVDVDTAQKINEIFFEVLIAPDFTSEALELLRSKKNRIILKQKANLKQGSVSKTILNGTLTQDADTSNFAEWNEVGARETSNEERTDLRFANIICKHLKSNAIALVKNGQLIGKGCGQTSRVDALRQALEKARQFGFELKGAVMASDAFFPFSDCVTMAKEAGIEAVIQPGGSVRDNDSIEYAKGNNMAMVMTKLRHFKH
ncbi:bifunctional phosphoribosylaminoimidazolecarboxamide formyltransferase/IMP cyclohydrolase [Rurimicrobium arvi]|uniref:Bifunctional purine biosynthesis protein PurH n=1 Tax=Rurimicrobium arvi TaxID=2049916 RepID=A0ABP8N0Y8_9BACT